MKIPTHLFWIKLHSGVRCNNLTCQNNENPRQPVVFFLTSSLAVKIDANMNDCSAESLRQQRRIGIQCKFSSSFGCLPAQRHVNVCQRQMKKKWWRGDWHALKCWFVCLIRFKPVWHRAKSSSWCTCAHWHFFYTFFLINIHSRWLKLAYI